MSVSLMHRWHDSCVGEWFLTPSPSVFVCALIYILWPTVICGGEWMHPSSVICYMLYVILLSVSGECGCVCNTQSFTNPLRSPLCYYLIFWGLPSEFVWGYLFWARDIILNNNNYFNLVLKPDYVILKYFENWTVIPYHSYFFYSHHIFPAVIPGNYVTTSSFRYLYYFSYYISVHWAL